jgi:hypothetical protein
LGSWHSTTELLPPVIAVTGEIVTSPVAVESYIHNAARCYFPGHELVDAIRDSE